MVEQPPAADDFLQDIPSLVKKRPPDVTYFASPHDWREELIYFLLPDRWNDGTISWNGDRVQSNGRPRLKREQLIVQGQSSQMPPISPPKDGPLTVHYWNLWAVSGRSRYQGGTLNGIRGNLGYLKKLGITALWIAPLCQQRAASVDANFANDSSDDPVYAPRQVDLKPPPGCTSQADQEAYYLEQQKLVAEAQRPRDDYHGYAIQDFLGVEPRLGTAADLKALITAAHGQDIRVIIDVVLNHSGECFAYESGGLLSPVHPPWRPRPTNENPVVSDPYSLSGWLDVHNLAMASDVAPRTHDEGVWPRELQKDDLYNRRGSGSYGGLDDSHLLSDYYNRDFAYPEKKEDAGPPTLDLMVQIWSWWIQEFDCDGFRIDTFKHFPRWVGREFVRRTVEFACMLGKNNFLMMAEIADNESMAVSYLDKNPGLNVLGIGPRRAALRAMAGGDGTLAREVLLPSKANLSTGDMLQADSDALERITDEDVRDRVVTSIDDHDGVNLPSKVRLASAHGDRSVIPASAFLLFGPGIPCLYYGTEQALTGVWPIGRAATDAAAALKSFAWQVGGANGGDRYLREAMFGPEHPRAAGIDGREDKPDHLLPGFGPMGTSGLHVFDPASYWYRAIASMAAMRRTYPVLATGLISVLDRGQIDGGRKNVRVPNSLVAWLRRDQATGEFALIVVNMGDDGPEFVAHNVNLTLPTEIRSHRSIVRRLHLDGYAEPDGSKATVKFQHSAATDEWSVNLGVVLPREVRVYLTS